MFLNIQHFYNRVLISHRPLIKLHNKEFMGQIIDKITFKKKIPTLSRKFIPFLSFTKNIFASIN